MSSAGGYLARREIHYSDRWHSYGSLVLFHLQLFDTVTLYYLFRVCKSNLSGWRRRPGMTCCRSILFFSFLFFLLLVSLYIFLFFYFVY